MKKIIIIAGGGTGGHIYPGVAIARALQKKNPEIEVHFVGSPQGLETSIVPREGFPLHLIQVGKLNYGGGFFGKIKTLLQIPKALYSSYSLLFQLKPLYVLGVGGYASGPFVLMASILGFKTAIWEPNAHPGMTNRWLSQVVRKSFVVFEEARQALKSKDIIPVGLPVREAIEKVGLRKNQSLVEKTQQTDKKFNILVVGGSQGARGINRVVSDLFQFPEDELKNIELVHQAGRADFPALREKYKNNPGQVKCFEFIFDVENYYQWADLVICRAGASTVAEVAACGKPAIFIPLPTAADNHQQKNAESLVKIQASEMILQKDLTKDSLKRHILDLQSQPERLSRMSDQLKKFYKPHAAESMSQIILDGAHL